MKRAPSNLRLILVLRVSKSNDQTAGTDQLGSPTTQGQVLHQSRSVHALAAKAIPHGDGLRSDGFGAASLSRL